MILVEKNSVVMLATGISHSAFDGYWRDISDWARGATDLAVARIRAEFKLQERERALLFVGSGFRTKGLDRAIIALATTRRGGLDARLFVVGQNSPGHFQVQARRQGVADQVVFLGGRHDVADLMLTADLLIHPAYSENTGTVLLEALTLGLPVLCTDVCGYAPHIEQAHAGIVLPSPFSQTDCDRALLEMLTSNQVPQWRANGLVYAAREDLYSCHEGAVEIIEQTVRRKLAALAAVRF